MATTSQASPQVYLLLPDPDRYQWVFPVRKEDQAVLKRFRGEPIHGTWKPPLQVEIRRKNDHGKVLREADFPCSFWPGVYVFSDRAVTALHDLLEGRGELFPLSCPDGTYFAFNVTRVVEALDTEHSTLKLLPTGRIMRVERYEFFPDRVRDEVIFKVPSLHFIDAYVTSLFAERIAAAGLLGFQLRHVWPADQPT